MKVSLNWAQDFSNVPLNDIGTDELLKKLGAQLGAIEDVEYFGHWYNSVVVAKVVVCEKHPNADRLNVCKINDGGVTPDVPRDADGLVQVVCGAPNVREGLLVAWIPPNAAVPASYAEAKPFILSSRELRGVVSNGMLASPKELGISDDHEGILEITAAEVGESLAQPGTAFSALFGVDDVVIDCENKMFTHRPDCFGVLGVAREIAGIQQKAYTSPDWYLHEPKFKTNLNDKELLPLESSIADEKLCSRIMFVAMKNIKVGKSPTWMQAGFSRVGLKPINNIVDLTNYYMYLTGQPIHAYDYDKVKSLSTGDPVMVVRPASKGETIALLNGKTIELESGTPIISTDITPVGIAGIMGGSETEVDENTTNIIIEIGTFDMYSIRRTSMQYGLFTDAVTRFNKGQSPLQNDRVLAKIMEDVAEMAGGVQASPVLNKQSASVKPLPPIKTSAQFINDRLGSSLEAAEIGQLLENVEIKVSVTDDSITVTPPFWRMDLEYPEDIVEEVGRLFGFDKLPVALPKRQSKAPQKNEMLTWKSSLRAALSKLGANELLTYSFVHSDLLAKAGLNTEHVFHIRNAISPELQYYRLTLMPSLLDKVRINSKADRAESGGNAFGIFEINKVHIRGVQDDIEPNIPAEHEHLAFVFSADEKTAAKDYQGVAYYQAATYLEAFMQEINVAYSLEPIISGAGTTDPVLAPFDSNRAAAIVVNGEAIGFIGEYTVAVEKAFKLPTFTAGFELNISMLRNGRRSKEYVTMPIYPKTEQDITFEVVQGVQFATIRQALQQFELPTPSGEHTFFRKIAPLDIFETPEGKLRYTFRVWLARYDKTLQTSEVNELMAAMADSVAQKTGAVRI